METWKVLNSILCVSPVQKLSYLSSCMTIDNFLPEAYQETWNNDDETMNSMFSTFKPKHLNIDNYTLKFDYWSSLILEIFKRKPSTFNASGSLLILDTDAKELTLLFKRKGQVPLCLDEVLVSSNKGSVKFNF